MERRLKGGPRGLLIPLWMDLEILPVVSIISPAPAIAKAQDFLGRRVIASDCQWETPGRHMAQGLMETYQVLSQLCAEGPGRQPSEEDSWRAPTDVPAPGDGAKTMGFGGFGAWVQIQFSPHPLFPLCKKLPSNQQEV